MCYKKTCPWEQVKRFASFYSELKHFKFVPKKSQLKSYLTTRVWDWKTLFFFSFFLATKDSIYQQAATFIFCHKLSFFDQQMGLLRKPRDDQNRAFRSKKISLLRLKHLKTLFYWANPGLFIFIFVFSELQLTD